MNSDHKLDEMSKDSNVRVVVRVRPPNEKELTQGKCNVVKVVDDFMLTFDPRDEDQFGVPKTRMSILEKKIRDMNFIFDRVFNDKATNEDVFQHTTKPVIESVLQGFNCSVFAYGATSAGKTHTMLGSPNQPGVIFLTMMELYKKLMAINNEFDTDISVSYLEIYNETCKDLLLPTGPLAVREDPEKGVCVAGLSLHKPRSAEELLEMLHFGNQNRTQHPTDANKQSSRSHAVFQVFVKQCPKASGITANVKVAKISLIDLAGSERATVTTNHGERLREGANINKSLLALGNCINALAENKNNLHVPYRNSKLTRLLKDSLGGNCRTIMIAAISPSTLSYEDTYNTLKYANRAKNIKSSLTSNTVNVDYHVSQYAKIIEDLKGQVSLLQSKLEDTNANTTINKEDRRQKEKVDKTEDELQRFNDELREVYKEQKSFLKQLIDVEATDKGLSLKLRHKERSFKRLEIIRNLSGQSMDSSSRKLENLREQTSTKQTQLTEQASRLKSSLTDNSERIRELQGAIDDWANQKTDGVRDRVNSIYESLKTDLDCVSLSSKYKHAKRHITMQDTDQKSNEKLITQLLEIITVQQNKLNGQSEAPNRHELTNHLADLPDTLICGPRISWADQTVSLETNPERESGAEHSPINDTNFRFEYKTFTPLKTPLRKPSVLRQIIHDSRTCFGRDNDTTFNTTMNTGPIRNIVHGNENKQSNETMILDSTYVKQPDDDNEEERFKTFVLSTPHNKMHSIVGPDTPPSGDFARCQIPVRTPLKEESQNMFKIPVFKKPRMRSFTEVSTLKGEKVENRNKHDRTFVISKLKKKHHFNVGMPMRSTSTLSLHSHKENVKPKVKSRSLRPSQSLVSLTGSDYTNDKSSKKQKARFRF